MARISTFKVAAKKGEPPFNPYIKICLSEYSNDSEGNVFLSPELMTEKEIDEAIDFLSSQLEKARKSAKRELKKAKA